MNKDEMLKKMESILNDNAEQIERLSKEVDDLENMKATLESRIADLEAQIEKLKCCGNCDWKVKGICNDNDNCELKDWKLVETWR